MRTPAELEARRSQLEQGFSEPITLDALSGDWKVYQRKHGHRYSTDDLLTAWYAARSGRDDVSQPGSLVSAPAAGAARGPARSGSARLLDLGSGIGSVGLLVLWRALQDGTAARLTTIEAQAGSFALQQANHWANAVEALVSAHHGDLREVAAELGTFDLVTGSPPYFDTTKATPSQDSQKAHARFELRGDVRDYCFAARATLAPGGRFVFCFPTNQATRAEDAIAAAGLALARRQDVVPKAFEPALFSLFACTLSPAEPVREAPLTVRDALGQRTSEMVAVRRFFEMPP